MVTWPLRFSWHSIWLCSLCLCSVLLERRIILHPRCWIHGLCHWWQYFFYFNTKMWDDLKLSANQSRILDLQFTFLGDVSIMTVALWTSTQRFKQTLYYPQLRIKFHQSSSASWCTVIPQDGKTAPLFCNGAGIGCTSGIQTSILHRDAFLSKLILFLKHTLKVLLKPFQHYQAALFILVWPRRETR